MTPVALLLAGEASGDEHGARLAAALRRRRPGLSLVGTGGPRMRAEGVELLADLDQLAVMGFSEVLPRLPFLHGLRRRIEALLDAGDVEIVVPIDYPGFNLRLARAAKRRGCPVLYYIAPKVWASRPGRTRTLARVTDRVAVVLPFEEDLLREAGVDATYVGHPLRDRPPDPENGSDLYARTGLEEGRPILALLPGSRQQEIGRHLELFAEVARRVCRERPELQPVVSRASTVDAAPFRRSGLPVVEGADSLLRHASAALVKSGTGTLEAALADTPMVVAYRTGALNWLLARALLRTEHVSLPNLIAGRALVPELLQRDATPEALAAALLPLLDPGSPERRAQLDGFEAIRASLGGPGAAERVAEHALELAGR